MTPDKRDSLDVRMLIRCLGEQFMTEDHAAAKLWPHLPSYLAFRAHHPDIERPEESDHVPTADYLLYEVADVFLQLKTGYATAYGKREDDRGSLYFRCPCGEEDGQPGEMALLDAWRLEFFAALALGGYEKAPRQLPEPEPVALTGARPMEFPGSTAAELDADDAELQALWRVAEAARAIQQRIAFRAPELLHSSERALLDALDALEDAARSERGTRRAPVQGDCRRGQLAGTVAWAVHAEAWKTYAAAGYGGQSAERIAARGGFDYREMQCCLAGHYAERCTVEHPPVPTWEPLRV